MTKEERHLRSGTGCHRRILRLRNTVPTTQVTIIFEVKGLLEVFTNRKSQRSFSVIQDAPRVGDLPGIPIYLLYFYTNNLLPHTTLLPLPHICMYVRFIHLTPHKLIFSPWVRISQASLLVRKEECKKIQIKSKQILDFIIATTFF